MKKNTKIILIIFIIVILALIACYAIIGMNHDNNGQDVFNQNNVLFKPKIGIISALDTETDILVKNLDNKQEKEIAGSTYYLGNIGNYQVIIVRCGMGKVSTAACTQAMIDEYSSILTSFASDISLDITLPVSPVFSEARSVFPPGEAQASTTKSPGLISAASTARHELTSCITKAPSS